MTEEKREVFCKDTLASEPLWFLKPSITKVAWGASASKSSVQDALPSDSLPGGHQEVTLKYMCDRAEILNDGQSKRKDKKKTSRRDQA